MPRIDNKIICFLIEIKTDLKYCKKSFKRPCNLSFQNYRFDVCQKTIVFL